VKSGATVPFLGVAIAFAGGSPLHAKKTTTRKSITIKKGRLRGIILDILFITFLLSPPKLPAQSF
jgi:hypothetical protein